MKNITHYFFYFLLLFITSGLYAQNAPATASDFNTDPTSALVGPAPEAAAIQKYIEVPISEYTGTPQLSIPISSISSGSLSVPVSLNYHASGLKVKEIASRIGAGWSLSSLGTVSRTVRGIPDDKLEGMLNSNEYWYNGGADIQYLDCDTILNTQSYSTPQQEMVGIANNQADTQPDEFFFSAPGISGKFVFRQDRKIVLLPAQDIRIQPVFDIGGKLGSFIITNSSGTKYHFTKKESSTVAIDCQVPTSLNNSNDPITTSWHLTHIEDAFSKHHIFFHYKSQPFRYLEQSLKQKYIKVGGTIGTEGSKYEDYGSYKACFKLVEVNGQILAGITNDLGDEIVFESGDMRLDMNEVHANYSEQGYEKLVKIIVKKNGEKISVHRLTQSYFNNPVFPHNETALRLDTVQECDTMENECLPPYSFTYDGTERPSRLSNNYDHWGYYNDNQGKQEVLGFNINNSFVPLMDSHGGKKNAVEAKAKMGILTQMTFPAGGYTNLDYELHDFSSFGSDLYKAETDSFEVNYDYSDYSQGNMQDEITIPIPSKPFTRIAKIFTETPFESECITDNYVLLYEGVSNIPMRNISLDHHGELIVILEGGVNYTLKSKMQSYDNNPGGQNLPLPISDCDNMPDSGNYDNETIKVKLEWFDSTSISPVHSVKGGGLRIREMVSHDGEDNDNDLRKIYEYTQDDGSGNVISSGIHPFPLIYTHNIEENNFVNCGNNGVTLCSPTECGDIWDGQDSSVGVGSSSSGNTSGDGVELVCYHYLFLDTNSNGYYDGTDIIVAMFATTPGSCDGPQYRLSDVGNEDLNIAIGHPAVISSSYTDVRRSPSLRNSGNTPKNWQYQIISHDNLSGGGSLKGSAVGYNRVSIYNDTDSLNGKTVKYFSNLPQSNLESYGAISSFLPNTSLGNRLGLLTKQEVYSYENNQFTLRQSTENEYESKDFLTDYELNSDYNMKKVEAAFVRARTISDCQSCDYYRAGYYSWVSDFYPLTETVSRSYDDNGNYLENRVTYQYDTKRHFQPTSITSHYPDKRDVVSITYPEDYTFGGQIPLLTYSNDFTIPDNIYIGEPDNLDEEGRAIHELAKRNIVVPVETTKITYTKHLAQEKKLLAAKIINYEWKDIQNLIIPRSTDMIEMSAPLDMASPNPEFEKAVISDNGDGTYTFLKDDQYKLQGTITKYNEAGNILEYERNHHNPSTFIWDGKDRYPIARIMNARWDKVFYTGFEVPQNGTAKENGNWNVFGSINSWNTVANIEAKTGERYFALSNTDYLSAEINQTANENYTLSFWYYGNGVDVLLNGVSQGAIANVTEWTYISMELGLPTGNQILKIKGTSTAAQIDELRLHPSDALMETYSFDSETNQLITSNNSNNIPSYYEYDDFLRLECVRDQDRNIIQYYEYLYHDAPNANGRNQVRIRTALVPGLRIKNNFIADFNALPAHQKKESIQYTDGLGRASQGIAIGQSTLGNDIVSFHEYDNQGREKRKYLPFTIENNTGDFVDDALSVQSQWYADNPYNTEVDKKIAETTVPFSETVFEASPLGKVLEQGAVGEIWQPNTNHSIRMEYEVFGLDNGIFSLLDPNGQQAYMTTYKLLGVINFQSENNTALPWYQIGEIMATTTHDENNHKTQTFIDQRGRTILVRKFHTDNAGVTKTVDTYNVYNDFNLLKAVIPPEAVEYMKSNDDWDYMDKTTFGGWCYYYEYDHRQRLSAKEIPGAGRTEYHYDKRDQLVLTQDAKQRDVSSGDSEKGLFTKYDRLGRPIQTGIYTYPPSVDVDIEIAAALETFEVHKAIGGHGYTNKAFPRTDKSFLTHSYYDDYDFNNDGNPSVDYAPNQSNSQITDITLPLHHFSRLDGQLTATRVKYEEENASGNLVPKWLTTATFYDDRMRVIQIKSEHHLGNWDITSTQYDFSGKVEVTKRKHFDQNGQQHNYVESFDYYDNGSLKDLRYKARYDQEYIRSRNVYNDLGQLMEKNLHSNLSGSNFLQSIDYRYNIRGWLESINDTYAPSSTQNVYSFMKGGTYTISFGAARIDGMDVTISKSIECTAVGEASTNIETESKMLSLAIPSGTLLSSLTDITINLDGVTDISGYDDIPNAINLLVLAISEELDAQGLGAKEIKLPITNELREMAKTIWYLIEDSHDLDNNDLYSQRLYYNEGNSSLGTTTGLAQYNGNISSTVWHVAGRDARQMYAFEYDDLDRLVKADYGTINLTNSYIQGHRYSVPKVNYDLNGNILNLKRRGTDMSSNIPVPTVVDDLSYTYDQRTNRLLGVHDAKIINEGFTEIDTTIIVDYDYDANGNMIVDRNKNLEIEYNHLNLPIHFGWNNDGNGNFDKEIRILYDAAGVKLRKMVIDSTILVSTKDYVEGIEYVEGNLQAVYHADGRCVPRADYAQYTQNNNHTTTTGAFVYEYTIKDHLGNARLTFADLDKDGNITVNHTNPLETEIIQENHYYPFGMEMEMPSTQVETPNKYTYNGKELNDDFGLNLSDYGARWYDASIGRWHSVDPLGESMNSWSPYNYTFNNPIKYVDPDGMAPEDFVILISRKSHGHMAAIIQNGNGDYYFVTMGATPNGISEHFGVRSSSGVTGGMNVIPLPNYNSTDEAANALLNEDIGGNTYTDYVKFLTSSDSDQKIFDNIQVMEDDVNSGRVDYDLLEMNCTDAVERPIEEAIDVKLPETPLPTQNFNKLKKNQESYQNKINFSEGLLKPEYIPSGLDNYPRESRPIVIIEPSI